MPESARTSSFWSPRLGRLLGIDIHLHVTFLLLLAFIGVAFWLPQRSLHAAMSGVLFFGLLFLCVLLHELGHALAARQYGIRTRDITLLPIGGVARLERMPDKPHQELWVAIAGPLVNVVIAGGLYVGLMLKGQWQTLNELSLTGGTLAQRLFVANLFLVGFNLLPAFPMDGGRVLRSLLAMWMPFAPATRIAARIGRLMAVLFGFAGLFVSPLLILIALFVWIGAGQEAEAAEMKASFDGVAVREAMLTEFQTLDPRDSLGDVARRLLAGAQQDFPVVDATGRVVGLMSHGDFFRALRERGDRLPVQEVMQKEFCQADAEEMLDVAMGRVEPGRCTTQPVFQGGQLVGLLTAENVGEFVMIQTALAARRSGRWTAPPPRLDEASRRPQPHAA